MRSGLVSSANARTGKPVDSVLVGWEQKHRMMVPCLTVVVVVMVELVGRELLHVTYPSKLGSIIVVTGIVLAVGCEVGYQNYFTHF